MKKINHKDLKIELHNILYAHTSTIDYEMSRTIILEYGGKYIVLDGGHCSCYDFNETEWDAIEYTEEELKKLSSVKEFTSKYF